MKKHLYSLTALLLIFSFSQAKHVESATAKLVAQNFIFQNAKMAQVDLVLSYTGRSAAGIEDYYAFTLNSTGFVIVSGDDVANPIIGYSTEDPFVAPAAGTNFGYWMGERQKEMEYIRANHLQADVQTVNTWARYTDNISNKLTPPVSVNTVAPLCAAKWGQGGAYNDLCPAGTPTGCVATAMAIIMKKWAYPTKGTGSSSYSAGSYGTLSANYGTTTYNWASMTTPYCSGSNSAVATIMSHCGISVEMAYSPGGSGAQVVGGNPSAQYSYKTYFGYNAALIKGLMRSSYQDPAWITLLKNDLDKGQPIQYAGVDASAGGHTWVCDGYDATDNMHLNWGWDGSSNGYFSINNMASGGYNFTSQHHVCIGIVPGTPQMATDAGVSSITAPSGTVTSSTVTPLVGLKNFGTAALTSCTINYKVDAGTVQTHSWTGNLATNSLMTVSLPVINVTAGAHTFTSYTSNPNGGADGNTANDQMVSNFTVSVSSGIADLNNQAGFTLFPNPAASFVTIEGSASGNVRYSICNMLGAEIKTGQISSGGSGFSGTIDVSMLPKGMYFLKVSDGDSSFTKKLNKQ